MDYHTKVLGGSNNANVYIVYGNLEEFPINSAALLKGW